ncbi:MAG: hypothetical protein FJW37_11080 [Acidobacteria bacterium]|nr:hypothetical protein [Acidobacteriota bacterium]
MSNRLKVVTGWIGIAALAVTLSAADEKKEAGAKKGGGKAGILQPEMTVEGSSYESPAGKLGEKTGEPWSNTTVAAAVNAKPVPGRVTTVTGEIIDLSCYMQLGKHGEKHKSCGQKCLQNGQPIGLLAKDGSIYLLMEEEHDPRRDGLTAFRKAAGEHMAHIMEVSGTQSTVNGHRALFVTGFLKK